MPDLHSILSAVAAFVIPLLIYGSITGVLNALLTRKSQIQHWAEMNPRAAAVQKLMRAVGFDPWNAIAAALLWAQQRLPLAQKAGAVVVEDGKIKPKTLFIPPSAMLALCLALLLLGCAPRPPSAPLKAPCDPTTLAMLTAQCSAQAFECGRQGIPKAECKAITECNEKLDARREACR